MKLSSVNKLQFGSPITGVALLKKQRLTFNISGSLSADQIQTIAVSEGAYVSDAQYSVVGGTLPTDSYPWSLAPRRFYFTDEIDIPTPRVYLYKTNKPGYVEIKMEVGFGSPSLIYSYQIHVDVWIYVSHFL